MNRRASANDRRRPSMIPTKASQRRRASSISFPASPQEVPWDLLDRLLFPLLGCHAIAIVLSGFSNVLNISHVSAFALFMWFSLTTIAAVMFYHMLKISVSGRAVLVTGCESPLGWCLARRLDEIGFTVFAGFSQVEECEEAELLKEESSGRMQILQLDVQSDEQMLKALAYIKDHLPGQAEGLWALIHCATWMALGELEWVPFPVLRKSVDINLLGAARLTQIMLPLIRSAKGRIVFLSSALSRLPTPVRGVQCATLAGLEGLATCLRKELRPRGVNVSVVAAGEFASGASWLSDDLLVDQAKDMWAQLSEEQKETYGEEYFEGAIRSLQKYTNVNADLNPTLRSLCDAITRTFPLPRYTPVTAGEKLQLIIAEHFPRSVYDAIYHK